MDDLSGVSMPLGLSIRRTILILLAFGFLTGCGFGGGGPSEYEKLKSHHDDALGVLQSKGASALLKKYPPGDAYVVDLSGKTIDDEFLEALKTLRPISELNLSGSTITDEQLASVADPQILGTLAKLDISNTQISDAGLVEAADIAMLYEVNVKGSKVTSSGIAEFKRKHPPHPFKLNLKIDK